MSDPVLIAYGAKRTILGRSRWTRIDEAYPHDEGGGLTLRLDALPIDGRVILLEPDAGDDQREIIRQSRLRAHKQMRGGGRR